MFAAAAYALFGLIIGSFLNVLLVRWGRESLMGRSACPYCGKMIAWYDNIPILSWLNLRGRCRSCSAPISLQYPLVEILTAAVFGFYGAALPIFVPYTILALPILALLIAIAVYDLYYKIIPNLWVYAFVVLAFLSPFFTILDESFSFAQHILAGPLIALPFFTLWFISRGQWMGFGDVKLSLGIGYLLGASGAFVAVLLAFILGAFVSVLILLPLPLYRRLLQGWGIVPVARSQSYTMKSEIPFGPFLIVSCLFIWFLGLYGISFPMGFFELY